MQNRKGRLRCGLALFQPSDLRLQHLLRAVRGVAPIGRLTQRASAADKANPLGFADAGGLLFFDAAGRALLATRTSIGTNKCTAVGSLGGNRVKQGVLDDQNSRLPSAGDVEVYLRTNCLSFVALTAINSYPGNV